MSWFRFNVTAKNRKPEFKMADKQEKMIIRTLRDRRCVRLLRFPLKRQQIKPEVNLILETRSTEITSVQRKKGIPRLGLRGTELTRKVFDAVDEANVKGRVKLANILFSLLIFRMQR